MANRTRNKISIVGLAKIGTIISINGQRFECYDHSDVSRKDGGTATVMMWRAECPECDAQFIQKTTIGKWPTTRRCPEHRSLSKVIRIYG